MEPSIIVAVDPGHPSVSRDGEVNWGAVSDSGLREVEINLAVAELLVPRLRARGIRAILTRTDNTTAVANEERIRLAAAHHARLVVRLHCDYDGHADHTKHGVRTFYPPPTAPRIHALSKQIAAIIHEDVVKLTGLSDAGIHDDTVTRVGRELGMLAGSEEADRLGIPTVLVEMVYLSNAGDEHWITLDRNKECMADALAQGITRAFSEVPLP